MNTFLLDIKLQWQNGFYGAAAFVTVIWILILRFTPIAEVEHILPFLVFGNLQISGLYFVAGIRLLEKDEGTLAAQILTPMSESHYLLSKVASLGVLTLLESLAFLYIGAGHEQVSFLAVVGIIVMSATFVLTGLICINYFNSLNEFMIPSIFIMFVLFLPVFNLFEFSDSWLFYLHPMQGPLMLLNISIDGGNLSQWMFSLISSAIVLGGLFYWNHKNLYKIAGEGL
ncbi:hypothetical protein [Marinicellulosiphila megalodicopiae]|uniref:fluoroquinolone export ABC transporter permease subunit n=1 Tax=Marinicellulosiphila megalodicopiae TaxID=2724896 RepID=UPI003BAF140E